MRDEILFAIKVCMCKEMSLSFLIACSGGISWVEEGADGKLSDSPKKEAVTAGVPDDRDSRIQAARERFLARKGKK